MNISTILLLAAIALSTGLVFRKASRGWVLLILSTLGIFWLQPSTPIRTLDFWLPVLTLALVIFGWLLSTPPGQHRWRSNLPALALLVGIVLLVALTRYLSLTGVITPSRPPQTTLVLLGLGVAGLVLAGFTALTSRWKGTLLVGILLLLVLLVLLKAPPLALQVSIILRTLMEQSTTRAAALDLRWLGYSYVAFRLIHTLRDRQTGRLPVVTLQEYANYVLFFPAFTAGPIDRLERFLKDLRSPLVLSAADLLEGGRRLVLGLFKKFVLADTLAIFALNAVNAGQVVHGGWMWVMLYGYTFQIYFDFAGYTDIAIGMGRLLGFSLPENFNAPYLKPNLTLFWNNWHMTLTQWFRAYFFNPVTRAMRSGSHPLPAALVLIVTQVSTMVLIGLWHGITWNFVIWGLWHGLGLFIQNRYSDWMRPRLASLENHPRIKMALTVLNVVLTFNFIALGWVWFALPEPGLSLRVFGLLFGMGGS